MSKGGSNALKRAELGLARKSDNAKYKGKRGMSL